MNLGVYKLVSIIIQELEDYIDGSELDYMNSVK